MKTCPSCGNDLKTMSGTFRFQPPPNIPGGDLVVENATWKECDCGERMMPAKLDDALDELAKKRLGVS